MPSEASSTQSPSSTVSCTKTQSGNPPDTCVCWACTATLKVPQPQDGLPLPTFNCGWCGALGDMQRLDFTVPQRRPRRKWLSAVKFVMERLVLIFVAAIIAGIAAAATTVILPRMFDGVALACMQALAMLLLFNIVFNYIAAVRRSAGGVVEHFDELSAYWQRTKIVPQGALVGYTYCRRCNFYKPPACHHCSVCGKCVVDMDHHCPFVANCVGRGNLRNFLLFLFWVVLSMFIALPLLAWFVMQRCGPELAVVWRRARIRPRGPGTLRLLWSTQMQLLLVLGSSPLHVIVAIVLFAMCCAVTIAVGPLFAMQMMSALRGEYYIDHLKNPERSPQMRWNNLQKIFGTTHPAWWLLPQWRNPDERPTKKSL